MKQLRHILIALLCIAAPLHADVKRESRHFLTTEAGIGYSALLNKSTLGKSSGLAGGNLQVGYEWNYRKLLVHTGAEFALISDRAKVNPFSVPTTYTTGLPAGLILTESFNFTNYTETQLLGQLNLPIQLGAMFADRYYFLAGVRVGLPLLPFAKVRTTVSTTLSDPTLIGQLHDVPVHDVYTSDESAIVSWKGSINAQVSAEVGLVLNTFWEKNSKGKGKNPTGFRGNGKKPILYRVGLFADYSVVPSGIPYNDPERQLVVVREPREMHFYDYFMASQTLPYGLLVGAKFAVLFQLNEVKPAKPVPSYFDVYIADAATEKPIAAKVTFYDKTKKRTTVRETKAGHIKYRAAISDYTITASNEQYYSDSQDAYIDAEGVTETLRFALTHLPEPEPVLIDTPIIDIPVKVGAKVVLHNLFFATGKVQILPKSEQALDELAAFMRQHEGVAVRITGHTDDIGSERDNQILSEGRANAVRDALISRGIAATRIEAVGKGENEPIADNATEEGRAKNRRVEFMFTATGDELIEQVSH